MLSTVPTRQLRSCFFFQAEDGIRDGTVTGVQTCALPISIFERALTFAPRSISSCTASRWLSETAQIKAVVPPHVSMALTRSEERRVGKECRSRWSADQ